MIYHSDKGLDRALMLGTPYVSTKYVVDKGIIEDTSKWNSTEISLLPYTFLVFATKVRTRIDVDQRPRDPETHGPCSFYR